MSDYIGTLNVVQKNNLDNLISLLNEKGITNKFSQAAIAAIVAKESDFVPKFEIGYSNTPNARIREIFSKTASMTDAQLNILKASDESFFNFVYGGKYGNNTTGDGFKYRGGGYNQLTFKGNYLAVGNRIGVDLVDYPERVNDNQTAALVVIDYFKNKFKEVGKNINGFSDLQTALKDFYQANAGWNKPISMVTGGYQKAQSYIDSIYNYINSIKSNPIIKK